MHFIFSPIWKSLTKFFIFQFPYFFQKSSRANKRAFAPSNGLLEGTHKHLVDPKRICAESLRNRSWINDSLRLRFTHLSSTFSQNMSMRSALLVWFACRY